MSSAKSPDAGRPFDHVLLVEDNAVIAMNTEALLEELGVSRVEVAGTVASAIALLGGDQFDLAILDYDLGGENSLPVADQLMSRSVPIVFSSGYGDQMQLPDGYGDVPMLKKPYTLNDLRKLLQQR